MISAPKFLAAGRAFLIVLQRRVVPAIVQRVPLRFGFFFLFHAADAASDRSDARLGAGGGVGAFHFFPEMLLRRAALRADVAVLRVPGVVCPVVGERVADDRLTILAEQNMGSVLQILVGHMRVGAVLNHAAAAAHVANGAVRVFCGFPSMVNINCAIAPFDTVSHNIAVIVAAAADVPPVGQGVAQRQHISVLQTHRRHGLTRVIATAYRVHPPGAAGIIELAEGAAGAGAFVQSVAVQAAPQNCKTSPRAEPGVDGIQHFLFRASRPDRIFQCICVIVGIQTPQIETSVQRPAVIAPPAESIACRTEGFTGVLSHDRLGDHIGNRLVRQNLIRDRADNTDPQHCHIYINIGFSDFLSGFYAEANQRQFLFAPVAVCVLSVNVEGMFISIPGLWVEGKQAVLPAVTGRGRICNLNFIQRNQNKFIRSLRRNADRIPCHVFSLRGNQKIGYDFVRNFVLVFEFQIDIYTLRSLVLIRDIDFENILISRIVFCFDREIILTGFSAIQVKLNRVRCFKGQGFIIVSGLSAFDGSDLNAVGIGTDNGHFVWQHIPGQLVVIHGIRRSGLFVLAKNAPLAAIVEGIAHFQRHIVAIMQNNLKMRPMSVCKSGNRNPIGIGGFPLRHFHLQPTLSIPPIQLAALGGRIGGIAGAHNSRARALGVRADQLHLVAYPATGQLIVLDFIRGAATRQTEQCAFVVSGSLPCKGKLYIRELLIRDFIPEKHIPFRSPDRK